MSKGWKWQFDFNIEPRSLYNSSCKNEVSIMQNCPFYVASNLLRVAANRQHSAGGFPPSSWHRWARAVGQSHNTMSDEMAPEPSSLPRSLSLFLPCLFLSHSLFRLNTPLQLKASLVLSIEERMQVERHFFFSSSQWENEPVSGIGRNGASTAFSGTVCECQFSTFPFYQT